MSQLSSFHFSRAAWSFSKLHEVEDSNDLLMQPICWSEIEFAKGISAYFSPVPLKAFQFANISLCFIEQHSNEIYVRSGEAFRARNIYATWWENSTRRKIKNTFQSRYIDFICLL